MIKNSMSTFLYFNYTLEKTIEHLAKLGYDGLEIWGGRPHAYAGDYSPLELKDLKKSIKDNGLEVSGFIPAQFRYPTNLSIGWEKVWLDSINYLKKSIDTAAALDSPLVSICPGHTVSNQTAAEGWEQFMKAMNILADYAGSDGPALLIEPAHPFESDVIPDVLAGIKFLEELNREGVGLVIDTGHVHVNGVNLLELVPEIAKYPLHFHIDDNKGESDEHLIPGEGNIDFRSFIKVLKELDYTGFLTAELGFGYTLNPDQAAEKSLKQVKSLLELEV